MPMRESPPAGNTAFAVNGWIERGIEFSMHGIFLGFVGAIFEPTEDLMSAGKSSWTMFLSAALLCTFTLFYWIKLDIHRRLPARIKWWLALSAPVVWIMVSQGVADLPEVDFLHTMRRGVPWIALVLLPALGAPEFRPRLKRVLRWHACIGVAICTTVLVTNWDVVTAKSLHRYEGMELKEGKALLYPVFFQLFQFKDLSVLLKSFTGLGILVLAIQAIVSATRQAVLLLGIALVIGGWTYLRQGILSHRQANFLTTALVVMMLGIAIAYVFPQMSGALNLTEARFTEDSGDSSIRENARWDELRAYFLEQATPLDYFFGRGVNGAYLHPGGGYAQTMHIGYGRYTLKGGVPILLLLIFGPIAVGVRTLFRSRSPDVLAAAGMCTWFGAKNLTGQLVSVNPQFFLIVISFGICLFALSRGYQKGVNGGANEPWEDQASSSGNARNAGGTLPSSISARGGARSRGR